MLGRIYGGILLVVILGRISGEIYERIFGVILGRNFRENLEKSVLGKISKEILGKILGESFEKFLFTYWMEEFLQESFEWFVEKSLRNLCKNYWERAIFGRISDAILEIIRG